MIKTQIRTFNISSKNASNGSFKSQVNITLPDLTFHNFHINNVYFSVDHCEIPNSFYIVNYTNNKFVMDDFEYLIPVGNYNVNSFITVLLSLLPINYSMTYSSITNKFTLSHLTTDFIINSSKCTINTIMGLGLEDIASVSNTVTLPYMVNFLPMQRINFRSNFFYFNNYNSTDNSSDVFLCLQNNAGQLSMINYVNQTQINYLIQDRSITSFIINVTDDNNNLINFNNIDWTMTLIIKIEYIDESVKTNFNEIIKNQVLF